MIIMSFEVLNKNDKISGRRGKKMNFAAGYVYNK